jgi:hypothetical protein
MTPLVAPAEPSPRLSQPTLGRLFPPSALPPEQRITTPAVPPTIQVRIGRIEVRAITAPPPPPSRSRSAAAAPRLSLQDYLKARNGGNG